MPYDEKQQLLNKIEELQKQLALSKAPAAHPGPSQTMCAPPTKVTLASPATTRKFLPTPMSTSEKPSEAATAPKRAATAKSLDFEDSFEDTKVDKDDLDIIVTPDGVKALDSSKNLIRFMQGLGGLHML